MTYFELMQKAGKQIHPKVYYYDDSNNKIEYDYDNIKKIKLSFNSDVVGTCMKGLTAILKIKLPDKAIYFSNTVKYNGTSATKTYGPFYFKSEPKYDADEKTYTHTMYDSFLTTMVDYEPVKITYPTTVLEFFKKLCQSCNLITNISSLPNGNRVMSYDVYSDIGFTYRDVFADIGQATATLFVVDNGEVKKRTLGTTEIVIDDDILRNQNISLGTHFGPINSIILSRSEGRDKIYKRDENLTSWNAFEIKDNQLMNNNNRSDYLDDLYSALYGLEYDIYDLELVGYGGFDPLDKIKVETGGKNYYSYVLNNEIEFTQGVKEIIYTEMPEQTQENYKTSDTTDKRISKAYILLDKQSKTIEQVVTSVNGQNEKISEITQNVDEINSKISDIADITTSGESQQASVSLEKVNESEPIAIKIHPISEDISYLYPSEFLYPSADLYLMNRVIRFTNTDTNEVFEYELPDDLLFFNSNNYDEFILNYDSQTCSIIKKVEYDKTTGKNKIKSVTETVNYEYPTITLTDGDYIISLPGYSNAYLYVQLMASNIYTTQFATKVEVKSGIKQTADAINLEVSKKVGKNEVISRINLTSEAATIQASKINISGVISAINNNTSTTINGDKITTGSITASQIKAGAITVDKMNVTNLSSISSNLGDISGGSLSIGDGKFSVTNAGVLTATSGTIGGWTLAANTLKNSSGAGVTTLNSNGRLSFNNGSYFFGVGNGSEHPVASSLSSHSVNYWTNLSVSGKTSSSTWIGGSGIYGDYLSLLCAQGQSIAIGRASGTGDAMSINPNGSLRYSSTTGDWTMRTDSGGIYLRSVSGGLNVYGSYDNNTGYHAGRSGKFPYQHGYLYFVNGIFVGRGTS